MLFQNQLRGSEKYRNWPAAIGFAVVGAAMAGVAYLVFLDNPLYQFYPSLTDIFEIRNIFQQRENLTLAMNLAEQQHVYWPFVGWLAGFVVGIPVVFFFLLACGAREIDPVRHISGRRHLKGWDAIQDLRQAAKEKIAESDAGATLSVVLPDYFFIQLWRSFVLTYNAKRRAILRFFDHPNLNLFRIPPPNVRLSKWTLSSAQEVQSVLMVGSQGGGKTQIVRSFIAAYARQKYKFVVLDLVKGDFSADFPSIGGAGPMLLGPWDSRSIVWDIARDLDTLPDITAWAGGFISVSEKDPLWGQAARAILIGCVMVLKIEKGNDWGWAELQQIVTAPLTEMKARGIQKAWPGCAQTFSDLESKTTGSIAQNFTSAMQPIYYLATAFAMLEKQGNRKIQLRKWLLDDRTKDRSLILLGNARFGDTAAAFFRSTIELFTLTISSLELEESKTRRIVFVLDELPQAGKLSSIKKLLEIGRSKGIAVVEAFQSISQFRQIYEEHEDAIVDALFGIKIFPRVNGESSQSWVAGQVGKRTVDIRKESMNRPYYARQSRAPRNNASHTLLAIGHY